MFQRKNHFVRGAVASLVLCSLVPSLARCQTSTVDEKNTLAEFIPEDVWLYSRTWRSPSRDVMSKHWKPIFEALKNCGIEQEFRNTIVATIPPSDRTEFQKKWVEVWGAIGSVNWVDLISEEFVIAERLKQIVPDMIVVFRPKPETLQHNVNGLARLFDLFNTYVSGAPVPPKQHGKLKVWSLETDDGAIGLHLMHIDDKIAVVFGQAALQDVRSLLLGEKRVKSIVTSARFQRAIKEVSAPGHSLTYMDMHSVLGWVAKLPELILGKSNHTQPMETAGRVVGAVVRHLDFLDYIVISQETNGNNQVQHTVLRIKDDCCKKPLARAMSEQNRIEDFTRYVPAEANAYFVSTLFNPRIIHDVILDVVRNDVPGGPEFCQEYESVQQKMKFNLCEDLLDWIGGEIVFSSIPPATPNPFSKQDGVLMLRVRDAKLARAKLPMLMNHVTEFLKSRGQQLTVTDVTTLPADGFRKLTIPTMTLFIGEPCFGIWDEWAVFGTSEEAVARVMNTASGKHPSIATNERVKREALLTNEPVVGASFADLSNIGQEMSAAFFGMGFTAGMLPNEPEMAPAKSILNSLVRLGPVMNQIDFLSSSSSLTTFKDNAWHSKTVTTYKTAASEN